jgi:CRISPR-associated protein Csx14
MNKQVPSTLIATLGSEAQVVTLALDLLLAQGKDIDRVIVLHTSTIFEPIASALQRLKAEFASGPYPSTNLLTLELGASAGPLADVDSAPGAEATFVAIYRAVRAEKLAGRRIHFSLAGGRKTMAVFGMAAAQMLFDEGDRLWHLVSYGKLLEEKRMHAGPGESASLIEIPVILWSAVSPVLTDLSQIDDPFAAAERQRSLRLQEALELARTFVMGSLSPAQRPVVELLVREGLSDADIAGRLSLSPRTVERHLGDAYRVARAHWDLPVVNRAQLVALLHLYYALKG